MHKNRRTVRVEWGHCDAAQIVFYPRYFEWFDQSTGYLFETAGIRSEERRVGKECRL